MYNSKYKKYKKKYINFKNTNNNFYLVHGTDFPHLKKILEQGYIYSGKYLPDDETRLGGWEKLPYIYCNIYFDDIKNLPHSFGYTLIINPKIIIDKGIIYNIRWHVHPNKDSIYIKPRDIDYDEKINLIKELVKNPPQAPNNLKLPEFMQHEILIKDKIDIHKYLSGIILPNMEGFDDNIKDILKKNNYNNVKIFTKLPDTKDLFTN